MRRCSKRFSSAHPPHLHWLKRDALAVFIGRFWSAPGRIEQAFPIDRRALAERPDLGLTEAKVGGAICTSLPSYTIGLAGA